MDFSGKISKNIVSADLVKKRGIIMVTLAKQIEEYLKSLLETSESNSIEISRNDLAQVFMCVPSQINYVLETRFNSNVGYLVETRRGGGGYIRIVKLGLENEDDLIQMLDKTSNNSINQLSAEKLLQRLVDEDLLTLREGLLLKAITDNNNLQLAAAEADLIRSKIIKTILVTLLREDM